MSCRLIKHFVFAKCSLYKMRLLYKDHINMQKPLGYQLGPQLVDLAIRRKRVQVYRGCSNYSNVVGAGRLGENINIKFALTCYQPGKTLFPDRV